MLGLSLNNRDHTDNIFHRPRLQKALHDQLSFGALWLQSPAGMGKSTIVSHYIGKSSSKSIWYNIDSRDRDLGYFLERLNISCGKKLVSKKTIQLISKPFDLDEAIFIESIFDEYLSMQSNGLIFVFDNCEQLPDKSAVIMVLLKLVEYTNQQIKVIFISRSEPPAEFSNLLVQGRLVRFTDQTLNFTYEEFKEFLAYRSSGLASIDGLYDLTDGWIAGVILVLESIRFNCQIDYQVSKFNYNTLFNYIASEIYHSSNAEVQQLLVSTCLVSDFSEKEATNLSHVKNARAILDKLCAASYFTSKESKRYTYHPLLLKFLQSILLNQNEKFINEIYSRTFRLLLKNREYEQALELCLGRNDWNALLKLLLKHAGRLVNQGKVELIRNTITQMPSQVINNSGWLLYWLGACYQPKSPVKAIEYFCQASVEFERCDDTKGYLLSLCGQNESTLFAMDDYSFLYDMVQRIESFEKSKMRYPSIECYARVAANAHTALLFSHPEGDSLRYWEKKINTITNLLQVTFQVTNRILIGMGLYYQMFFQGKISRARVILNSLKPSHLWGEDAASKIAWHMMNAMQCWIECEYDECEKSSQIGIELAEKTGLMFLAFPTVLQGAYGKLNQGDLVAAEAYVPLLDKYRRQQAKLKGTIIDNFLAELEIKKGNINLALELSERAVTLEKIWGMKVAYAYYSVTRSEALIINRQYKSAASLIEEIRVVCKLVDSPIIAFRIIWLEAKIAYQKEQLAECLELLKQALAIASREGFINHLVWIQQDVERFYQLALDHGVEVDYIRRVCKKRGIKLDFDKQNNKRSKSIQIKTLGEFKITIEGEELKQSRKTKKKPIELLKFILASQIEWVKQADIQDQLWPDSEGDASAQALYTTLHRLRKLLGDNQVIERRDGRLRLIKNNIVLDIDYMAEQMQSIKETYASTKNKKQAIQAGLNLVETYHGEFLPGDDYLPIVLVTRQCIKSKLNRFKAELERQQKSQSGLPSHHLIE